jgi:phosphoribosyl 1,2-cyclic phosphate phosphodiesterase
MESSASAVQGVTNVFEGTLEVLFMGTGSSTGVPMIGCRCPVCVSSDPKNERTRSSILVRYEDRNILIDTATDLRIQSLRHGLKRIDAVFFTHSHADHILGIDELRTFNYLQKEAIHVYGDPETLRIIMNMFPYAFSEKNRGGVTRPKLVPHTVETSTLIHGVPVVPFPVEHGPVFNHALRVGNLVYLTDCNRIPDESMSYLDRIDTLIIGAVRYEPHESHFGVWQALELVERLKPRQAFLTHLSHGIDHETLESELPPNVHTAYDGLTFECR